MGRDCVERGVIFMCPPKPRLRRALLFGPFSRKKDFGCDANMQVGFSNNLNVTTFSPKYICPNSFLQRISSESLGPFYTGLFI